MESNGKIINDMYVDKDQLNAYIEGLIGKIFAVLGVYEDCTDMGCYDIFDSYIFRVICEVRGFYKLSNATSFISLSSILEELHSFVMEESEKKEEDKILNHKRVKSLVFHCISIVKKAQVV